MHLITSKYLIANKFLAYCYGERNSKHKPVLAAEGGGREVPTHFWGRGRGRGWSPTSGDGVGSMSLIAEFKSLETAPSARGVGVAAKGLGCPSASVTLHKHFSALLMRYCVDWTLCMPTLMTF